MTQTDDARVDVEQAFMAVVWDALKADATDLRKQQRILSAFRATQPDPLADPRVWEHPQVWELIEAVEDGIRAGLLPKTSASEGGAARHSAQVKAADRLRAALAAFNTAGGKDE